MTPKTFPILGVHNLPDVPAAVPWSYVAPHAAQAYENHGQTLERLAERGGLAISELAAVVGHRPWRAMSKGEIRAFVERLPRVEET